MKKESREARHKRIQKNLEREGREKQNLKLYLAAKHKLEINGKFDKAWNIAWREGHSSGLSEVALYFDELAELLKQ